MKLKQIYKPLAILSAFLGADLFGIQTSALTSDQIVSKLLEKKSEQIKIYDEKQRSRYPSSLGEYQSKLPRYKELYPEFEAEFETYKQSFPRYEVGGNLTYMMSIDEITDITRAKFKTMREKGELLSKVEFQKLDKSKWFNKGNDVGRIWGAEYLSKKFSERGDTHLKVPKYIIVVDDLQKIQLQIWLGWCFPIASIIENGEVYAEKIEGKPETIRIGFGYTDYSGVGNILKTNDNMYYVVDSEYKSFYDGTPERTLYEGIVDWSFACEYFHERFGLINQIDSASKTIVFSVE